MTNIKITKVGHKLSNCVICEAELKDIYWDLDALYTREGITISNSKGICNDCYVALRRCM